MTQGKTIEESGIRKAVEKTQTFDGKKQKQMFEEARRELWGDKGSSSKTWLEVREFGMPLAFDQYDSPRDGKEASKLVSFLYMFIEMIKDEKAIQELQNLVRQYEIGRVDPLLNKVVQKLSKKRRTNKELHLNTHIGEYDIDYVVLDLGLKVNVMTKQTWALMGKPKLIYSPIRIRMDN
jgi:CRISPR/Cas system CSM-associated protein Csm2 small subunit